ncbi:MAG: cupin domain-containing protein [Hyphomicrobiaceae bacterium]
MSDQDHLTNRAAHRSFDAARFSWDGVPVRAYKNGEGPYRDVTRNVLFEAEPELPIEWRYFNVAPGGWSTLERHQHIHWVMIARGHGQALIDRAIRTVAAFDLIRIPPMSWHQFRAAPDSDLGFLCVVAAERDRPQLPSQDDLAALSAVSEIAEFIRP